MGEKLPYDGLGALAALLFGDFHPVPDEDGMEIELTVEPDEIENGDFFDADDEDDEDEDFDKSDIEATRIIPDIESVIFSGPATTIIWADGEKTTVKCSKDQQFDRYAGFAAAVCKRLFGSTSRAQACMEEKDAERQADLRAAEKAKRAEEEKKELRRKQTGENHIPTFEQFNCLVNKRLVERAVEEAVEEIVSSSLKQQRIKQATDDIFAAMRKEEEKKDV